MWMGGAQGKEEVKVGVGVWMRGAQGKGEVKVGGGVDGRGSGKGGSKGGCGWEGLRERRK